MSSPTSLFLKRKNEKKMFKYLKFLSEKENFVPKKLASFIVNRAYRYKALIQLQISSIKQYNWPKIGQRQNQQNN